MQVTIFGATGHAGALVVQECLSRGWQVRAFVRNAAKLAATAGLTIIEGNTLDAAAVRRAVAGADAVLGCLGMADITVPATDFSDGVKHIVAAMQAEGVRRFLMIGSANMLPHPAGGLRYEHLTLPDWLRHITAEHIRNYETLRTSGLAWTLLCPAMLVDDIPADHVRYAFDDLPTGTETGYAALAATMVALIAEPAAVGQRVGIVSDR